MRSRSSQAARLPWLEEAQDQSDEKKTDTCPAQRCIDRIGIVGGLARVVALQQPHGLAAADVDRRIEDHAETGAQVFVKFSSSARPVVEDFSGWNWLPNTLSRATTEVNGVAWLVQEQDDGSYVFTTGLREAYVEVAFNKEQAAKGAGPLVDFAEPIKKAIPEGIAD